MKHLLKLKKSHWGPSHFRKARMLDFSREIIFAIQNFTTESHPGFGSPTKALPKISEDSLDVQRVRMGQNLHSQSQFNSYFHSLVCPPPFDPILHKASMNMRDLCRLFKGRYKRSLYKSKANNFKLNTEHLFLSYLLAILPLDYFHRSLHPALQHLQASLSSLSLSTSLKRAQQTALLITGCQLILSPLQPWVQPPTYSHFTLCP